MTTVEPIALEPAGAGDLEDLVATSKRAFDADVDFGAPGPCGPPGYDSVEWHARVSTVSNVFRLVQGGKAVGGAIVYSRGPGWWEVGRIWLVPEAQGRGLGADVLRRLEEMFPAAERWTLDTPTWNLRNQHFYGREGYVEVRRTAELVYFEKVLAPAG